MLSAAHLSASSYEHNLNIGAGVFSAKTNMVEGIKTAINIGESTISSLTAE